MKKKISISMEEKTILKLEDFLSEGTFRNKSHLIELATNKFIREIENETS